MGRRITTGDAESLQTAPKIPNNVTATFFNTVYLRPKDLRFEHRGANLASCSGGHLTSLRPCKCQTYASLFRGHVELLHFISFNGIKSNYFTR